MPDFEDDAVEPLRDCAKELKRHPKTLEGKARRGEIPAVLIGRRWYVPLSYRKGLARRAYEEAEARAAEFAARQDAGESEAAE